MAKKNTEKKFVSYTQFYIRGANEEELLLIKYDRFKTFTDYLYYLPDQGKFYLNGTSITQRISANAIIQLDLKRFFEYDGVRRKFYFGIKSIDNTFTVLSHLRTPVRNVVGAMVPDETLRKSNIFAFRDHTSGKICFVNGYVKIEFEEYTPQVALNPPDLSRFSEVAEVKYESIFQDMEKVGITSYDIAITSNSLRLKKTGRSLEINKEMVTMKAKLPKAVTLRSYHLNPIEPEPRLFKIYHDGSTFVKKQEYWIVGDPTKNFFVPIYLFEYLAEV